MARERPAVSRAVRGPSRRADEPAATALDYVDRERSGRGLRRDVEEPLPVRGHVDADLVRAKPEPEPSAGRVRAPSALQAPHGADLERIAEASERERRPRRGVRPRALLAEVARAERGKGRADFLA